MLLYWKDNDYAVKLEDLQSNKILYSTKIQDNCFTEPRVSNGKLYFPESNYIFTCVDYHTKRIIWKLPTKGKIREFQIVKDDIIIASIDTYGIIAIHKDTGKILYERLLYPADCIVDLAPRPIGFNKNYFYTANFNCAALSAYEISTGRKVWNKKENPAALSNFSVAGKYIFLGSEADDKNGEIMLLEAQTGKIIFRQKSSFNIFIDPVFYQNKVYYHTRESQLKEFDIDKKTIQTIFQFNTYEDIGGTQMYQLDHFLFYQDLNYNIIKIDLNTFKKEIADKGEKGLLGVYKVNNETKFVY